MNGLTHTYNLTVDGLAVTAVLTFNGAHGILLCSYDDRSISVRLGWQVEYMREDACRALKSRRVMADMVGEAPYSRKATCRSIANRLDLLVGTGHIEADTAQEVINEVRGKWRGLQTSHDFDRFVSTNLTAKQHLALCKRTDDDFETLIAPALAKAIKEDIETDLEIGAPVMPTGDRDAALTIAQLATGKVNEVLAFHKLPTADTYAAGIDTVDEEIAHLRGSLDESDDLASDRWTALTSVNEVLRGMLDDRGVPSGEHIGDNLRSVVEYLNAVEAAAAKWQAAGLAWQKQAQDDADMLMNEAMLRMYPRSANPCNERLASRVFLPTPSRDLKSAADAPCGSLITGDSTVVRFPDGTGWHIFDSGTSGPDPLAFGWSWPPPDQTPAQVLAENLTKEECLLLSNMSSHAAIAWCSTRAAQGSHVS